MNVFKYLWYLIIHKWYVFLEGHDKCRVPFWQLVTHDLSKFRPDEFWPYYRHFYVRKMDSDDHSDYEYHKAWQLHVERRNLHHWQAWVVDGEPLLMPVKYVREMLADWAAMGRQQGRRDVTNWYYSRRDDIKLHHMSRLYLEALGYETGLMLVHYDYWRRINGR